MEKIRNAADKHCEDINTLRREPQTVEQIESEITKSVKEERAPDLPTPTPNPLAAAGSSAAGTGSTTPRQHSRKQSSMVAAAAAAAAATAGSGKRGEGVVPSDPPKVCGPFLVLPLFECVAYVLLVVKSHKHVVAVCACIEP